jgi:type VI secretion system protein VasD
MDFARSYSGKSALAAALVFLLALAGCATSSSQRPVQVRTELSAAADINPDASKRASPLVVRVFELRNDAAFNGADFFALYEREKQTLGESLIEREEFVLQPGAKQELRLSVSRDARFLAVIAAYRDISATRWRALVKAPRRTATDVFSRDRVTIDAARGGITLSIKD